jgi:acyl-CoA synthetase (NDP forming)
MELPSSTCPTVSELRCVIILDSSLSPTILVAESITCDILSKLIAKGVEGNIIFAGSFPVNADRMAEEVRKYLQESTTAQMLDLVVNGVTIHGNMTVWNC